MAKRRKKDSIHSLSRESLRAEHKDKFLKELMGESDRAAALVAAAEVESYLVHLLMSKFTRLSADEREMLFFGPGGALSQFAARIFVAYGLGVIHLDERADLDRIRHIRNTFAHSVIPLTFDTKSIAKECERLHYRNVLGDESPSIGQPKLRYILTALSLRKVFFDRVVESVRETARSAKDPADQKRYMAEIDAIMNRDT